MKEGIKKRIAAARARGESEEVILATMIAVIAEVQAEVLDAVEECGFTREQVLAALASSESVV